MQGAALLETVQWSLFGLRRALPGPLALPPTCRFGPDEHLLAWLHRNIVVPELLELLIIRLRVHVTSLKDSNSLKAYTLSLCQRPNVHLAVHNGQLRSGQLLAARADVHHCLGMACDARLTTVQQTTRKQRLQSVQGACLVVLPTCRWALP